jgi:hypothetical protein
MLALVARFYVCSGCSQKYHACNSCHLLALCPHLCTTCLPRPVQNCVVTVDWSSLQSPVFHVAELGLPYDPNGPLQAPSVIDLKWVPGQGHGGMSGLLGTSDRSTLHLWTPLP